jgi:hypothetical protein
MTREERAEEFKDYLESIGLYKRPKPEKPKPVKLAISNPNVPLGVQGERIKQRVDQYKADHDREMKALREEEEKREDEWRKRKAREQQTALLQQKLDLARYAQLELGGSLVKHAYDPFSRQRMWGHD